MTAVESHLVGTVVSIVDVGSVVEGGNPVAVIESMKMEHLVLAPKTMLVTTVYVQAHDAVEAGTNLLAGEATGDASIPATAAPAETARNDMAEVVARHQIGLDQGRPEAVAERHAQGRRTARENIADLVDDGSFIEFGALAIAAQRRRRDIRELIERTPADGLVGGIATINAQLFGADATECIVASYDYMVLAGTQGMRNHLKKDRLFDIAARREIPVVLYTEGGGGRPGDVDMPGVSSLDCFAFALFGELAGSVPLIGINSGYCFAGNAALLGTCDVVIATPDSNIGMAGPAMIDGAGLGNVKPTDIGPTHVHLQNGLIDILAADEIEATDLTKRLVGFTQGRAENWSEPDPATVRTAVPTNRKHVYDMGDLIAGLADLGSELELRPDWNPAMVTSFARIEGRPVGIIANNPAHLSGTIDNGAATKSADFMDLCDRWSIPILFLCDTPGFMVGPESDAEGLPRSAGRLFRRGSNLNVPFGTVIVRKCYGLGAQVMMGGGLKQPLFTVAWPTGEFGAMGIEGAVKLGFSRELESAKAEGNAEQLFDELVDQMYERGKALNVASHFEIDDVIDPAETRAWVSRFLC